MTAISPLLQDADRKLSRALSATPGARLHATEAAAAIAAMARHAEDSWTSKALALAMNVRHRAYECGVFDAGGWANDPACGDRLESAWAELEAHIAKGAP